jgi:hypothetical protein
MLIVSELPAKFKENLLQAVSKIRADGFSRSALAG